MRYILDKRTLQYKKQQFTFKQWLLKNVKFFSIGVGVAVVLWVVFILGFDFSFSKVYLEYKNSSYVEKITDVNKQFDSISNRLSEVQRRDDQQYRVIAEMKTLSETERNAGIGGIQNYNELKEMENGEFVIESNRKGDQLLSQLNVQYQSYLKVNKTINAKNDSVLSVPAIFPISPETYWITSGYGYRFHPILKRWDMHDGIDISAKRGRNIYSTGKGIISRVSYSNRGYGNMVLIDHGYGFETRYAHLQKINVKKGEAVSRGSVIGTLGNTGRSTGPHLHYEVIYNGKRLNPKKYYKLDLTVEEYSNMVNSFN